MPEMGGGEVAVRVCEDRPSTLVLYMSGYPDDAVVQRSLAHSAVRSWRNPLTPES